MYFFPEFGIIDKIDIDSFTQSERCVIAINFEGLKCGICEKEFEKDEDVVVCPECGTPMHRSCYKETGVCPAADKHSDGFVFEGFDKIKESAKQLSSNAINKKKQTKKEVSEESQYPCHLCGEMNKPNANFCNRCGTRLIKPDKKPAVSSTEELSDMLGVEVKQISPVQSALDPLAGIPASAQFEEDVTAADMACYIAVNTPYYMRAFDLIKRKANKFNWSAAVFSGIWFLYRKMYKVAAILIAVGVLFSFINTVLTFDTVSKTANSLLQSFENYEDFSFTEQIEILEDIEKNSETPKQWFAEAIQNTLELITAAITGIFAFYWYKKHTVRVLKKYKESNIDLRYYRMGVLTLGGTSGGFAFLGVALILVLNFIISFAVMIISFI